MPPTCVAISVKYQQRYGNEVLHSSEEPMSSTNPVGRLLKGSDDGYPLEIYSNKPFKLTANPLLTKPKQRLSEEAVAMKPGKDPFKWIFTVKRNFFGSKTVRTEAELLWLLSDHVLVFYTAEKLLLHKNST